MNATNSFQKSSTAYENDWTNKRIDGNVPYVYCFVGSGRKSAKKFRYSDYRFQNKRYDIKSFHSLN